MSLLCIHGLDDSNCPVCRVSRMSIPKNPLNRIDIKNHPIKPENPSLKHHNTNQKEFEQEIMNLKKPLKPKLITSIPKPNLINELKSFENPLQERVNLLDINYIDSHGISKKVNLKKAELDLEK